MSVVDSPSKGAQKWAAELLNLKWVSEHHGDRHDFLARHRRQVTRMLKLGRAGVEELAPALLCRISDERNLRAAWAYLAEHGGQAPGPDRLRYCDVPHHLVWQACRGLRDEIRSGTYELGNEAIHRISKGPGRGKRPLILQSILDRVVQRSCVEILQPVLDPQFDPRSFGYRPRQKKSPQRAPAAQHALATVEHIARAESRWVWVVVDVKDAFGSVPLHRLLDIVRSYLPDDKLAAFLKTILGGAKMPGLRQGGPLSPLLLNLYLHHLLDRKWRKLHPSIPLVRYADDLLLLCRSAEEAGHVYDDLVKLLQPAGMLLKESKQEAVRDLAAGAAVAYMGFRICKREKRLRYGLTANAWFALAEGLALAQEGTHAPIRAVMALAGWIAARGPCYPALDHEHAAARIASLARKAGFDEMPGPKRIKRLWQRAYARWRKLRKSALSQ